MEVILLNDVDNVGLRGEVVNVARGYARNYLLPRRMAEIATASKVAELQKRESQRARHEARSVEQAKEMAATLEQTELRFDVKAGPTGSLFGSVTPTDIADEIWRVRKIRVDRRKIGIDTIKRIGRHEVPVELFQDVNVIVRAAVVPEGGELPSDEELAAMESAERGVDETATAEQQPDGDLEAVLAEEDAAVAAAEPAAEAEPELEPEPAAEAEAPPEPEPAAEAESGAEEEFDEAETAPAAAAEAPDDDDAANRADTDAA
jgi:large subunit ribosomal protein L9